MGKGSSGSAAAEPSTTTQIQDIPSWEQGYVTNLLGQAQTEAAQPYQQFSGPTIAGFTGDQNQAFSNIEGNTATNTANQAAAMGQANQGANTANNIYNAGQGYINQATQYNPLAAISPYLNQASQYNSASAAQPWLNQAAGYTNAAANAATPQGIQAYLSPYTQNVVGGIENEANQNWNQNIMPGVNNEFIGSGGFGGGRSAQVLGQAAGNFQTGLSANVSNALNTGYQNATQAAQAQAGIYGNLANTSLSGANTAGSAQTSQIQNLLNQGQAAGTATQQQASNLQAAGTNLGNLANTQANAQLNAGNVLSNIGTQAATTNLNQDNALQAVGQQQQQLNQSNLTQAKSDFENQVNYPEQQTAFLNQIIRGLPSPTATTSQSQTPAYSVSPLAGLGGSATAALAALNSNKRGGLIKKYAKGGTVTADDSDDDDYEQDVDDNTDYSDNSPASPLATVNNSADNDNSDDSTNVGTYDASPTPSANDNISPLENMDVPDVSNDSPLAAVNPTPPGMISDTQSQKLQLLKLAQGMLTPQRNGQAWGALGAGIGGVADIQEKIAEANAKQQAINSERTVQNRKLDIAQQNADTLADYRQNGGASGGKLMAVQDSDGKTIYATPADIKANGYTPIPKANQTPTLSPAAIDMYADAVSNGATASSLGLGYGASANKTAVLNRVAEKYPTLNVTDAQTQLQGDRAGARKVGTMGGQIEFASQSLGSMIPLAKEAANNLDSTQYPDINSLHNAVLRGTGDKNIVALDTYLGAVISDKAALLVRNGNSSDTARAEAERQVNAAMSKGQLNTVFDSLGKEVDAQRSAQKNAMSSFKTPNGTQPASTTVAPPVNPNAARIAAIQAKLAAPQ